MARPPSGSSRRGGSGSGGGKGRKPSAKGGDSGAKRRETRQPTSGAKRAGKPQPASGTRGGSTRGGAAGKSGSKGTGATKRTSSQRRGSDGERSRGSGSGRTTGDRSRLSPKGSGEDRRAGGRPPRRDGRSRRQDEEEEGPVRKDWGGVARRGARKLSEDPATGPGSASAAWRATTGHQPEQPPEEQEEWVDLGPVRKEATSAVDRGRKPARRGASTREEPPPLTLHEDASDELRKKLDPATAKKVRDKLKVAARAFERERYQDARRVLAVLAKDAPGVATVRELYGLTLYRLGKWREAARELEAFRLISGSTEQHPVLADCYRALGRYQEVDQLWDELRQASPGSDLVTEGRIVAAGAKADQGDIDAAVLLLREGWRFPKKPKDHHLRRAYALADLYERAGDLPRARELFTRIDHAAPRLTDARQRAKALA